MMRTDELHAQQVAAWSGDRGAAFLAHQEKLDRALGPVATAAIALAAPRTGESVLDVGCGCGATTLMLADAVGSKGHVTGLDVSAAMLARARERSVGISQIEWLLADAASHDFAAGSHDLLFSRFGVMFFGDPVAAFTNLRRGLRPGCRLVFACWRGLDENPWMRVPFQAVLDHVPRQPRPGPDDPGPNSFADRDRVTRILTAAGFAAPVFTPLSVSIDLADGGGLEAAARQAVELGPTRGALEGQPEGVRATATEAVREALRPHLVDGTVVLPGAVWLVSSK